MKDFIYVNDEQEMEKWFRDNDYFHSKLIVDSILNSLENPQELTITKFKVKSNKLTYLITIDPEDYKETLEGEISTLEEYEDYERCNKIIKVLEDL